ncbi:MAG: hypothetical protein ACRDZ9_06330 [Acidimicrobiales bacterium]
MWALWLIPTVVLLVGVVAVALALRNAVAAARQLSEELARLGELGAATAPLRAGVEEVRGSADHLRRRRHLRRR